MIKLKVSEPKRAVGESGGAATVVLLILVVLGLLALVGYLAATVNHGRYRFALHNDMLVIERGRLLPIGYDLYQPESETLRAAYSPIPIPEGAQIVGGEVFSERGDLDRAIFTVLTNWVKERLNSQGEEQLNLATMYLTRADLLSAISEEQRSELRRLNGQLAYNAALWRINSLGNLLKNVRSQLQTAVRLGVADANTVDNWLNNLDLFTVEYERLANSIKQPTQIKPPDAVNSSERKDDPSTP
ncbi:MAG: hypothetical protein JW841_17390 [Deltaproteobacteria bacterium]|nr:hypothetical protein [Deltaproteobacteria bacterium]